jgi:hypothetical protein
LEEEVRTTHIKIQVNTTKPEVGTKPLIVVQVETIETVVEETNV